MGLKNPIVVLGTTSISKELKFRRSFALSEPRNLFSKKVCSKDRGLIKNKKGIVYTTIVIVILTLFLLSFSIISKYQERKLIQKRIDTMNNFLFSVEEDLSRKLFISGFRIIFLFEKDIIETGNYISDINASFSEAFFNSTINGKTNSEIEMLVRGINFSDIEYSINQKANEINVEIQLANPQIQISQEDPWNVKIIFSSLLSMRDKNNLASWNRTQLISTKIPVEGFEDPIYPIESNDISIINVIARTPYSPIGPDIGSHAQETYYSNSTESPSFLDRLKGNLASQNPSGEKIKYSQ